MKLLNLLLLLISVTCIQCGNQSLAGGTGTGSEFGDGKIVGTVYLPDGKPGAGVTVFIRNKEHVPFAENVLFFRTSYTDYLGKFVIDSVDTGDYLIEMKLADSLFSVKTVSVGRSDSTVDIGNIEIRKQIEYKGTVLYNRMMVSGAEVLVLGMDRKCSTDSAGKFLILLPQAKHLFSVQPVGSDSSYDFYFDETDNGDTLNIVSGIFTVIEDFDSLDDYSNLQRINGGGKWFAYTNEIEGGESRFSPAIEDGIKGAIEITGIDDKPDIYRGGSLHLLFQNPETQINGYGTIGTFLGDSSVLSINCASCWFDLSAMKELTFVAKGTGTIAVQFKCRYMSTTGDSQEYVLEKSVNLTPEWKTISILPSEFEEKTGENILSDIPVDSRFSSVSYLGFYATKPVELFLDEIVIDGVGPETFQKKP